MGPDPEETGLGTCFPPHTPPPRRYPTPFAGRRRVYREWPQSCALRVRPDLPPDPRCPPGTPPAAPRGAAAGTAPPALASARATRGLAGAGPGWDTTPTPDPPGLREQSRSAGRAPLLVQRSDEKVGCSRPASAPRSCSPAGTSARALGTSHRSQPSAEVAGAAKCRERGMVSCLSSARSKDNTSSSLSVTYKVLPASMGGEKSSYYMHLPDLKYCLLSLFPSYCHHRSSFCSFL